MQSCSSNLTSRSDWSTPPGSPRPKLRVEYSSRISSPAKRRLSAELGPVSPARPAVLRRHIYGEVYNDRFIPSREAQTDISYTLNEDCMKENSMVVNCSSQNLSESSMSSAVTAANEVAQGPTAAVETMEQSQQILNLLLKSELLGIEPTGRPQSQRIRSQHGQVTSSIDRRSEAHRGGGGDTFGTSSNILRFQSPRQKTGNAEDVHQVFSLLSVGEASRKLLSGPCKTKRRMPKAPFKVLDAPALHDDFYLNLVDWSAANILAVGLGASVYLWGACTSKVTKLCELGPEDTVTSVSWGAKGSQLAIGTNLGEVQIWDTIRCKRIRSMAGHNARVGTMSWNSQVLATGSRDRAICLRDIREREPVSRRLFAHKQEVCGLRWSFDDTQLASGGNDNKLFVWNLSASQPVQRCHHHTAAVKAIAWSPHEHGLLASGGGTADRHIRFWHTLGASSPVHSIDTGSQVCNLMWAKNVNEIVSTHGYSLNQVIVWGYPSMQKQATLTGHTCRVLYLAMSPDGQTIVTGAGDETLRFWNLFPRLKSTRSQFGTHLLFSRGTDIR